MSKKDNFDKELSGLFEASRDIPPTPSDSLLARVMADATAVQAGFAPAPVAARTGERPRGAGLWRELLRALGGWPAMGGLATAAVAGVWLGAFPPSFLPDATDAYIELTEGAYLIDTTPVLAFDLSGETL